MGNAECCGPRDTSGVKINDPSKLARDGPSLEKVYKEGSLWVLSSPAPAPAPEKPKTTAEDTPKGEDAAEAPAAASSTAPQWDKRYVVFTLQKVLVFPNEEAYKQKQESSNVVTVVDDANFAIKSLELTAEETEQIDALKKEQEELAKSAADGDKKKKKKKKKKDSDDEESDEEDGDKKKKKKKKNSDDEQSDESDSEAEDDEEEKDKKAARAKEIESLLQNLEFKRLSISITSSNGSVQVRSESTEEKEAWLLAGTQVQTDAGSLRQQIKDKQAKQEEEQKQQENSSKAAEEKGADKRSKEVGDVPSVQPIELEERYKALPTEVQDIIITLKEIDRDLVAYSDRDLATGKGKALNNKLKSLKPKLAEQKRNFPAELKDVVIQYNKLVHELPIKVNTTINNYNRAHAAKSSMF